MQMMLKTWVAIQTLLRDASWNLAWDVIVMTGHMSTAQMQMPCTDDKDYIGLSYKSFMLLSVRAVDLQDCRPEMMPRLWELS